MLNTKNYFIIFLTFFSLITLMPFDTLAQMNSHTPTTDIYNDDLRDNIILPHKTYNFGRRDNMCYDSDKASECKQRRQDCISSFFGLGAKNNGGGRMTKVSNCEKEFIQCMKDTIKPCDEIHQPTTDRPEGDTDGDDAGGIPRNR